MRKQTALKLFAFLALFLAVAAIAFAATIPARLSVASADDIKVASKSAYVIDFETGTVIFKQNEKARLPIASMTKIMSLLLTFEAIDKGELSLDEMITISPEAAGMGGSQIFLDAGSQHKASDLIKAITVASANDACVAIAERIAGSEMGFTKLMNKRAQELGMQNTHFANCTGLPAPENFSCAEDVSVMMRELAKHDKYYEYSKVWLEDYVHPSGRKTCMTNTNKLVRFYNGCDGGKTGFTQEAGHCLSATAKRGDMRIIATVICAPNSKQRFADVSNLFNYAFGCFENKIYLKAGDSIQNNVEVVRGKQKNIELTVSENLTAFVKRGEEAVCEIKLELPEKIKAPLKQGDVVGKAYIIRDGKVIDEAQVIVKTEVPRSTLLDDIKRLIKNK
ncbi:MAG: D-alanyl-D-alanine carboxypeptidase [Clostridiales bacterium]|nr:D-alanyl-D-alanine carboxypeptidase [Clostridiales bacterium]